VLLQRLTMLDLLTQTDTTEESKWLILCNLWVIYQIKKGGPLKLAFFISTK
jgi:hypothetical protein